MSDAAPPLSCTFDPTFYRDFADPVLGTDNPPVDALGGVIVYGYQCARCSRYHWSIPALETHGSNDTITETRDAVWAVITAAGARLSYVHHHVDKMARWAPGLAPERERP